MAAIVTVAAASAESAAPAVPVTAPGATATGSETARGRGRSQHVTVRGVGGIRILPPSSTNLAQQTAMSETSHRITTLDCGVRVVSEPMPAVRSVALGFWIGAGSAQEREEQAGISHLLEHMLFRGSERYGSEEIDQIFDAMGAELNAGTDKEATSVYTRVLDRHLERAFDVIADMVWRPRMGELEAEREVVLEEIAMYEDDPQDRVFDVLGEAVFGEHPLGRPVIGRAEVVGALTREQLRGFHAERYAPADVVISAAGSVDHDALVEMARGACPQEPSRSDGRGYHR